MKIVLEEKDYDNLIVKKYKETPENSGIKEYDLYLNYKGIEGTTHLIQLEDMTIATRKVAIADSLEVITNHKEHFFKMHFELEGHSHYKSKLSSGQDIIIEQGCCQLFYLPEVNGSLFYPSKSRKTLEINISVKQLKKIFHDDLSSLLKLGRAIDNHLPCRIYNKSLPLTPEMRQIVQQIMHCNLTGTFKRVYLESKVTELLILQLENGLQYREKLENKGISPADIEKLHFIKEIIEKNIFGEYSLLQLSKQAGINLFKLKNGFKKLFGYTVFGYINELKMEEAKRLIITRGLSVSEVAFMANYKNPQHFTVAFKKKFGKLPSEFKQ